MDSAPPSCRLIARRQALCRAVTLIAALGLSACGSAGAGAGSTRSSASQTAVGIWVTTFTGNERFRALGHQMPNGQPRGGPATLTITPAQATMRLFAQDMAFALGPTFHLGPGQMTFGADPKCLDNYPRPGTSGTYSYTLNGNMLTLRVIHDSCLARIATLTLHPWRHA